jgi:ribosomal protein S18 acetylase RimI-like enzyme
MHTFVTGVPEPARSRFGISATRLGGATVLALANDPTDYWSKALGFGVTEPVTRELMTEVVRAYERSGSRLALVQIAPAALPEDWAEIAADLGLEQRPGWVKLQRDLTAPGELPEVRTDLRIAPVAEHQLAEWARVLFSGFGMPADYDVLGTSADPAVFRRFGAWDGDRLVAAASLVVDGDAGAMFGAATLPGHRGRGAQSGLLAARLRAAAEAGIRWVSAETGAETPEWRNPSLHNIRRAGLVDLYERPNWLWRAR